MAFGGEVLAASRPQAPLLQARVYDSADRDVRFVSFLPTNRNDLVWKDDARQRAWKTRIALKMGLQAENIAVLPYSSSFRIVAREPELGFLLEKGMIGGETISTTLDSGTAVSRENQFEVVAALPSEVVAVWLRQPSAFRLRCDQGAGEDIWFVTCEELEARWTQMCANGRGADVRRELNLVLDSLDRESASLCKGGHGEREAWRAWLFEYKERTPATWPSIVFQNSYSGLDGRAGPVVVTCGKETSPEIPPDGTWTKTWENWKGPPESSVVWTFRAPDENLLDEDFGRQVIGTWSPKGGASNVLVKVDVQAKPRPYLVLGRDVIPGPDIWAALGPSGDENQDCELEVKVVYRDAPPVTYSGARGSPRRLLPNADGAAWNWKAELLPNTEIVEVAVSSRSYLSATSLHLDKQRYRCGETAHVRRGEKANLLPWPPISVRNESEFPVDYELSVSNDVEKTWTPIDRAEGVKPKVVADFNLFSSVTAMRNFPATNVTVRIAGSAPGANNAYINFELLRGGGAVNKKLKQEYTPIEWVSDDGRLGLIDGVWSFLMWDYTFQRDYPNPEAYLNGCRSKIFQDQNDPTFKKILDHCLRCQKKGCKDCTKLRAREKAQEAKIADAPANIVESWNKMAPVDQVPTARGRGTYMVALLLALCEEYYEDELGRDPLQAQGYENIAKRLSGEWP